MASGGPIPRLLKANLAGELLTSDNIGPSVQAVVGSAAGQSVVNLPDTTPFHAGDVVNITSGLTSAAPGPSTLSQVQSVAQGSITTTTVLRGPVNVGDVVTRIPVIDAPSRKRAWDFTGFAAPAQGNAISLLIAAVAGQKLILNHLSFIIINTNAAAATGVTFDVKDNNTLGPVLWATYTGIQGVTGSVDRYTAADLAVPGVISHALQIEESASIANTSSSVSVGGYTSIAEPV